MGAPFDADGQLLNAGSVCVYWYNGTSWLQRFKTHGSGADRSLGYSVSIEGNYAVAGMPGIGGGIRMFFNTGNNWGTYANDYISNPTDNVTKFGSSTIISGDYMIIGAESDPPATDLNTSRAFIYRKVGTYWQKLQTITDPLSGTGYLSRTYSSVAIDGVTRRFIIGAPWTFNAVGKAILGKVN